MLGKWRIPVRAGKVELALGHYDSITLTMDNSQLPKESEISPSVASAIGDISAATDTVTRALCSQPPGYLVRDHLEIINQNMKDVRLPHSLPPPLRLVTEPPSGVS